MKKERCQYCERPATCSIEWATGPFGKPGPVYVVYCGQCSIKEALAKRGMTASVKEGVDYVIIQPLSDTP